MWGYYRNECASITFFDWFYYLTNRWVSHYGYQQVNHLFIYVKHLLIMVVTNNKWSFGWVLGRMNCFKADTTFEFFVETNKSNRVFLNLVIQVVLIIHNLGYKYFSLLSFLVRVRFNFKLLTVPLNHIYVPAKLRTFVGTFYWNLFKTQLKLKSKATERVLTSKRSRPGFILLSVH